MPYSSAALIFFLVNSSAAMSRFVLIQPLKEGTWLRAEYEFKGTLRRTVFAFSSINVNNRVQINLAIGTAKDNLASCTLTLDGHSMPQMVNPKPRNIAFYAHLFLLAGVPLWKQEGRKRNSARHFIDWNLQAWCYSYKSLVCIEQDLRL